MKLKLQFLSLTRYRCSLAIVVYWTTEFYRIFPSLQQVPWTVLFYITRKQILEKKYKAGQENRQKGMEGPVLARGQGKASQRCHT